MEKEWNETKKRKTRGEEKKMLEKKGHKCYQRAGAPLLWRQAERAVHSGEEKVLGKPQNELPGFKAWLKERWRGTFCRAWSGRTRGNSLHQKRASLD